MTDGHLQQLLSNVSGESLILLEYTDAATVGRHYEKEGSLFVARFVEECSSFRIDAVR